MNMRCAWVLAGFSVVLLVAGPALAGSQEESKAGVESSQQRQQCDAACRENYQNNAAALQACLRSCGAVGPAEPAATAGAPDASAPATETAKVKSSKSNSSDRSTTVKGSKSNSDRSTTVKGSKSNSSERQAADPVEPPAPVETSNLNLSKSNINRDSGESSEPPSEATNLNSSKSNIAEAADADTATQEEDQR